MLGAAAAAITPAVGTEPVKESRLMPGCAGERRAGGEAGALHDVEDPGRQLRPRP